MAKTQTGGKLKKLGYPQGPIIGMVIERCKDFEVDNTFLEDLWRHPENYSMDKDWSDIAKVISDHKNPPPNVSLNISKAPYKIWGEEMIDDGAKEQFYDTLRLSVSVRGALMPDAHIGYSMPIGGVVGLRNAVCPVFIGVDIACRMRMSIFSDSSKLIVAPKHENLLRRALKKETAFGLGAHFDNSDKRDHSVMDDPLWLSFSWLNHIKDRAWTQLGSSGTGNHFGEFGLLNTEGIPELGIEKGEYLALLTHSGSRGMGNEIAKHYTKIAMDICRLPSDEKHLAWLGLDTEEGIEYWEAMNLAGRYASANHQLIHKHVARTAGLHVLAVIENHHNFGWKEEHFGEELIVHRKGATPAGKGVLGVIPGTMADVCHVVRGLGSPESLNSAAHGAGRHMSRKKANQTIDRMEVKKYLEDAEVDLISAGLDESPQAYKKIAEVMAAQVDLVESIAEFRPRIVMMAPAGERPED